MSYIRNRIIITFLFGKCLGLINTLNCRQLKRYNALYKIVYMYMDMFVYKNKNKTDLKYSEQYLTNYWLYNSKVFDK